MTVATEIHKSHWTGERIARLGFLRLGRQTRRQGPHHHLGPQQCVQAGTKFGLGFRAAAAALALQLPLQAASQFEAAASKRGLTGVALIYNLNVSSPIIYLPQADCRPCYC